MEGIEKITREGSFNRLPKEEGRALYEPLWGGGAPDAFSLLANGVKEVGAVERRKTGSYADVGARGDINGSHGGMAAIRRLQKEYFPEAKIVANSYNAATPDGRWPEERHAEVAASEFKAAGVPEEDIIVQEESFSTFTELLHNIRILEENGWRHVVIFTNGAQAGRTRAMLEHIDDQQAEYLRTLIDTPLKRERYKLDSFLERKRNGEAKISIVVAEDALERMSEGHARLVEEVRETPLYQESKQRQDAVIPDLEAGTYGVTPPGTTITGEDGRKK